MDAFRRSTAFISALLICALAAACTSGGPDGDVPQQDVPSDQETLAPYPTSTSVPDGDDAPWTVLKVEAQSEDSPDGLETVIEVRTGFPDVQDEQVGSLAEVALEAEVPDPDPVEAQRLFGPSDGGIFHDPSNTSLMRRFVGADESDVVVSADFTNPFNPERRPYDYGFIFRSDLERFHAVVLAGDGTWHHYVSNGITTTEKESGTAETAMVERGEGNSLALVASGQDGWFFVNGLLVANLDLSGLRSPGDVGVVANLGTVTEVLGAETRYESLVVGELALIETPVEGVLSHGRTSRAESDKAAPTASLFAEVDFDVPYAASDGDWSYGFLLETDDGSRHQITFNDRALWRLTSTPADPDGEITSSFGSTPTASFDVGTRNRLTVTRIQGEWRAYLNGGFLAVIEVEEDAELISLRLVGGVELFEQPTGSESSYSGFNAWALGN